MEDLIIKSDYDNGMITVRYGALNVSIPIVDFALMSFIHNYEDVSMTELCFCYQEQFGGVG